MKAVCGRGLLTWVAVVLMGMLTAGAEAQVPELINYQGRLVDNGTLVNGSTQVVFQIFPQISGGTPVYQETQTVVVVDGLISTFIGASNSVPGQLGSILTNSAIYLEVSIGPTVLTPRQRIGSVAYAGAAGAAYRVMPGGVVSNSIDWSSMPAGLLDGDNVGITSETDPVFSASPAAGITVPLMFSWTTAYGWGNHASAGYLDSEEDPEAVHTDGSTSMTGALNISVTGDDTLEIDSDGTGISIGNGSDGGTDGVALGANAQGQALGAALGTDTVANNEGVAIGNSASANFEGSAVGAGAVAWGGGSALGFGASATESGIAVGYEAEGNSFGVAIGQNAYGNNTNIAIGQFAFTDDGSQRIAIGNDVSNEIDDSAALRGTLYLDGGTGVYYRPNVGVGTWSNLLDLVPGGGTETDPVWTAASNSYYLKAQADAAFATGTPVYVEADPVALLPDGSRAMTGTLDMGGNSITNIGSASLGFADGETISSAKVGHWDAAYGWGDHDAANYATGTPLYVFIESDPVWTGASNLYYSKTQIDSGFVAASGDTMSGDLNLGDNELTNVTAMTIGGERRTNWPSFSGAAYVAKVGDTMTGQLTINAGGSSDLLIGSSGSNIGIGNAAVVGAFGDVAVGSGADGTFGTAVGYSANANNSGTAVGRSANAASAGTAVGESALGGTSGVAVGFQSDGSNSGAAMGYTAKAGIGGAALGYAANAVNSGVAVGTGSLGTNTGVAVGHSATGFSFGVAAGAQSDAHASGVALGYQAIGDNQGVAVGYQAKGSGLSAAIGYQANADFSGVAVGTGTRAAQSGAAVGSSATATNNGAAVGSSAFANNAGAALGGSASGNAGGAAVGNLADADNLGAAVGKSASAENQGSALGATADADNGGIAIGYGADGQGDTIAIGTLASTFPAVSGTDRISIGRRVTNSINSTVRMRGSLYLDGGTNIFYRPTFGTGTWQDLIGGLSESDPVWTSASNSYYLKTQADAIFLTSETDPNAVLADGSRVMTGDLDMGGNSITNVSSSTIYFVGGGHAMMSSGDTMTGPLTINADGSNRLLIDSAGYGVAIGNSASTGSGVAIGHTAEDTGSGVAVGQGSYADSGVAVGDHAYGAGTAVGSMARATQNGVAVGDSARAGGVSIALGRASTATNYSITVGEQADSRHMGVAIGFAAQADGVSQGYGFPSYSPNIAIGQNAVAVARTNMVSIGTSVSNNVDESVRLRGDLYLDGGTKIYARSAFGSGGWTDVVGAFPEADPHAVLADGSRAMTGTLTVQTNVLFNYIQDSDSIERNMLTIGGGDDVEIGNGANGYRYGAAVGYQANGYLYGAAVGYGAYAYNMGVALGYTASAQAGVAIGYQATGTSSVAVGYMAKSKSQGVTVGNSAQGQNVSVAVGGLANAGIESVAVGYTAVATASGTAVGYIANGGANGAAVGRAANASGFGAALGQQAYGQEQGVAVGGAAVGYNSGVGIGYLADGSNTNIAIGLYASTGGGSERMALGHNVTNDVDNTTRIRGDLYIDGGTEIFTRPSFGTGGWTAYPGGWSGVVTNYDGTATQLMYYASGVLTNVVYQ